MTAGAVKPGDVDELEVLEVSLAVDEEEAGTETETDGELGACTHAVDVGSALEQPSHATVPRGTE